MRITKQFIEKGGTELGALSTTTALGVAIDFSRSNRYLKRAIEGQTDKHTHIKRERHISNITHCRSYAGLRDKQTHTRTPSQTDTRNITQSMQENHSHAHSVSFNRCEFSQLLISCTRTRNTPGRSSSRSSRKTSYSAELIFIGFLSFPLKRKCCSLRSPTCSRLACRKRWRSMDRTSPLSRSKRPRPKRYTHRTLFSTATLEHLVVVAS